MPVLPRAFPDLSSDVPAGPANPGSLGLIAGLSALAFILLLTTIALGILLLYKILRRRKLQELDPPAQEVVIQEAPPSSGPPGDIPQAAYCRAHRRLLAYLQICMYRH